MFLSGMLIVAICLVDVRGGVGYLCFWREFSCHSQQLSI